MYLFSYLYVKNAYLANGDYSRKIWLFFENISGNTDFYSTLYLQKLTMPPPRDRMAAMQAQAYMDEDDYNIPMDEQHDPDMQDFFRQIEEMRDTAGQVSRDVEKVKKLQNDILSSPTVDAKMKQELDDTMNNIKKKANTIRTGLKKMEVTVEEEEKNNAAQHGAQLRMKKTQLMAVSKTFIEMMTEYNKIQTDFK